MSLADTAVHLIIDFFGGGGGGSGDVGDVLGGLNVLNGQIDDVYHSLVRLNENNYDLINNRANAIERSIDDLLFDQTMRNWEIAETLHGAIIGSLTDDINRTSGIYNILTSGILESILSSTRRNETRNSQILSTMSGPWQGRIDDINSRTFSIEQQLNSEFGGIYDVLGTILGNVEGGMRTEIVNQIIIDESIYQGILGSIQGIMEGVLGDAASIVNDVTGIFGPALESILGSIALEELAEQDHLKRLADIFDLFKTPQLDQYARFNDRTAEGFGGISIQSIVQGVNEAFGDEAEGMSDRAQEIITEGLESLEDFQDCGLTLEQLGLLKGSGMKLADWFISLIMILVIPLNMAQVKANREIQNYRRCFPDALPQPGDVASMMHRDLISVTRAREQLRKQGYTPQDTNDLLNSSFRYPPLEWMVSMYLRGTIDEGEFDNALRGEGYFPFYADRIKELAFFIPPVQDLITMMVREAFDPEQVALNQQDADFPDAFSEWGEKQGLSEFWQHKYWQAHWALPSVQMGYEMLHRRVINADELKGLMKALDIMPGWRDRLIEISYAPLTRVDIRRMHSLGVLDDTETRDAYKDIGYNEQNADRMLEFTKLYNEGDDLITLDVASDLTRTNIINFYKDGIIDRTLAAALLLQAGINVAAAELFLQDADFDIERRDRTDQIGLIYDRFTTGSITFEEASNQIASLELETRERALAQIELVKLRESRTKIPSRADLDKFYKAGQITDEIYLQQMGLLGYQPQWAEQFLMLLKGDTQ